MLMIINISLLLLLLIVSSSIDGREIRINLPNIRPDHDEHYLCMAHRLSQTQDEYIVGFTPNATADKVHHILMYGCQWPGVVERDSPHYVWDCGEMHTSEDRFGNYEQGPICAPGTEQSILFSWAMDAPAIELPKGVGFRIGGKTKINFIVLQVHYGSTKMFARNPMLTDNSGIFINTVPASDPSIHKQAGVLLLASYGRVLRGESKHEISCTVAEDKTIHPFRFRTHTHKLGTLVSGYKLTKDGKTTLIGEGNPQLPQMFYPIKDKSLSLTKGDMVFAYCNYNNTMGRVVDIGMTGQDEMCNFYLMYWTDSAETLNQKICLQANPSFLFGV